MSMLSSDSDEQREYEKAGETLVGVNVIDLKILEIRLTPEYESEK